MHRNYISKFNNNSNQKKKKEEEEERERNNQTTDWRFFCVIFQHLFKFKLVCS